MLPAFTFTPASREDVGEFFKNIWGFSSPSRTKVSRTSVLLKSSTFTPFGKAEDKGKF